jgi:hypothetical protein
VVAGSSNAAGAFLTVTAVAKSCPHAAQKTEDTPVMEFIQVTALPDNPDLSLIGLVVAVLVALGLSLRLYGRLGKRSRRRYPPRYWSKRERRSGWSTPRDGGIADPKNQLEAIAKVDFERQRLLNASERRVFIALEAMVAELGAGHRVMAQTSVGELLRPKAASGDWKLRKDAYASINSKRFDFAVVDADGMLALAVEYQGEGHHQEKAFMRDAVKREACRRAGVPFLEVEKGMKPAELRQRVMGILAPGERRNYEAGDRAPLDQALDGGRASGAA